MTIWLTAAALELIGHTVHGASPQSCEDKEGVDVGIGIYINNVAVVNSEYGTANLDFYVYFQAVKCQYPNDAGNDGEVSISLRFFVCLFVISIGDK